MLKLQTPQRDPYWLDLPGGARLQMKPVTVAAIIAARSAAAEVMKADGADVATGSAAFTRSLARWGIAGWEGIGDTQGKPIDPSPENTDALLEVWQAYEAIDRLYVTPALIGADEKNA